MPDFRVNSGAHHSQLPASSASGPGTVFQPSVVRNASPPPVPPRPSGWRMIPEERRRMPQFGGAAHAATQSRPEPAADDDALEQELAALEAEIAREEAGRSTEIADGDLDAELEALSREIDQAGDPEPDSPPGEAAIDAMMKELDAQAGAELRQQGRPVPMPVMLSPPVPAERRTASAPAQARPAEPARLVLQRAMTELSKLHREQKTLAHQAVRIKYAVRQQRVPEHHLRAAEQKSGEARARWQAKLAEVQRLTAQAENPASPPRRSSAAAPVPPASAPPPAKPASKLQRFLGRLTS